jgi:hypothetical protein
VVCAALCAASKNLITLSILDQAQPTCARCQKSGFACDGYPGRNFIQFDSSIKHKNAIQSYKFRLAPSSKNGESLVLGFDPNPAFSLIPQSPSILPMRDSFYFNYSAYYLLKGIDGPLTVPLPQVLQQGDISPLVKSSISALVTTCFGFRNGQASIVQDGQSIYGVVLRDLNAAIIKQGSQPDFNILIVVVVLCMVEVSQMDFLHTQRFDV